MSEWIDFSLWDQCETLARPGYVFEVVNAEDQSMLTVCVVPLEVPFDWASLPLKFRMLPEPSARHSNPIPPPAPKP